MTLRVCVVWALILGLAVPAFGQKKAEEKGAERILESFVDDFRHDAAATEPMTFGLRVNLNPA